MKQGYDAPEGFEKYVVAEVAGGAEIAPGEMAAVNGEGYAVAASGAAGERVIGRAEVYVNHALGADGGVQVHAKRGTFLYQNDTEKPVGRMQVGAACFVKDATTVAAEGAVVAGVVHFVQERGVWVRLG